MSLQAQALLSLFLLAQSVQALAADPVPARRHNETANSCRDGLLPYGRNQDELRPRGCAARHARRHTARLRVVRPGAHATGLKTS